MTRMLAALLCITIAGCAAAQGQTRTGPGSEDRLACAYELPRQVESGSSFPVGVVLQNVSTTDALEVITNRGALEHFPVTGIRPTCDAEPESRAEIVSCPQGPAAPAPPQVVTLAPGQAFRRDFDINEEYRFKPGRCVFHGFVVYFAEHGAESARSVRCTPAGASVEVVARPM